MESQPNPQSARRKTMAPARVEFLYF